MLRKTVAYLPKGVQRLWMFYCSLSSGNKSGIWLANGILFGSIYGTNERLIRETEKKTDLLEIIEYRLTRGKERVKEFEKIWNDSARRSQNQKGYGWTRMYKAIAWNESPFHYLSCRLWEDAIVEDPLFEKQLVESRILDTDEPIRRQYVTVVDDSVVRTI